MKTRPFTEPESLEDRIAPAGLVTAAYDAATGELNLTGDGMDNSLEIFQTGPNTYRLESETSDINVLGTSILDIGKLTRVTIDGGAGSDSFGLSNVRTLTALSFTGGSGDDSFFADNLMVKGAVDLDGNAGADTVRFGGLFTMISGNVTIDSDSAATDSIDVQFSPQKTVIGGSVRFSGGGGLDVFQTDGPGSASIAKGIDFNAGAGGGQLALFTDTLLSIGKLPTGESIAFTGGDGNDVIAFSGANAALASGIRMTGGNGTNTVSLGNDHGTMRLGKLVAGQSILFTGGADIDSILTDTATLTLAGGIEFAAGDGTNLIDLVSAQGVLKIGKLASGRSILFNGGSGSDGITSDLARVTLAGGIELIGAGGGNEIEFDDGGVVRIGKFGTGQSVDLTGTTNASNSIDFGGFVTVAGSVEVTGGTGSDEIDFDGKVNVGKSAAGVSVLLTGGDGEDQIDFADNITLAGSLKLVGGNHDDELNLGGFASGLGTLTVKGAAEMDGGPGDDTFFLLADSVVLGSTVTFTGGDDADTFTISTGGSIAGNVSVDLGAAAAGTQTVFLSSSNGLPASLVLKGLLVVDAAGVTTADTFTLKNVSVAKLIDLTLGDGVSTVNIDNLIAGDEFRLDTRGGADVVNIERRNLFGGSVIKKLATIQLGIGDDQLLIGNPLPTVIAPFPDHTRVNFLGGLNADGGGGVLDNRNDIVGENDGVVIAGLIGFELSTLV